jgi:predicted nucleotidyltransferase component of viral defense system
MPKPKKLRDVGASVRARLLALARQKGQAFDLVLTRYAIERLLHRLSISPHRDRFVLKGAMLMTTWFDDPHRPTRDVDFLGYGDPSPDPMLATFREICEIQVDDGVAFDVSALRVELIREALDYGGLRLRTVAQFAGARVTVVIDVGFGDAIEPGIEEINLPVLLDLPQPRLRAYARETVIAEKFQAMVMLGFANSRMKDFYDVWILSRTYDFDMDRLSRAIEATFDRRGTAVPLDEPDALTQAFASDAAKQRQWAAFARDVAIEVPPLEVIVVDLAGFLMPPARRATERSAGGPPPVTEGP